MIDIEPLYDGVVIEHIVEEQKESGIFLPEMVTSQQRYLKGKIVEVGKGYLVNGVLVPLQVVIGDIILYPNHSATIEHIYQGNKYIILKEQDIIGKFRNG